LRLRKSTNEPFAFLQIDPVTSKGFHGPGTFTAIIKAVDLGLVQDEESSRSTEIPEIQMIDIPHPLLIVFQFSSQNPVVEKHITAVHTSRHAYAS